MPIGQRSETQLAALLMQDHGGLQIVQRKLHACEDACSAQNVKHSLQQCMRPCPTLRNRPAQSLALEGDT